MYRKPPRVFRVAQFGLMVPTPGVLRDDESDVPEVLLDSISIRVLTGDDEVAAAARAFAAHGQGTSQIHLSEAELADAVVAVNGAPLPSPFLGLSKWDAPVLSLVRRLFRKLNDLPNDQKLEDFLEAEFPTAPKKLG